MALENDTQAPDFDLANQFGEHVRLSDFRGKKPVALVFFPLAFSSTCTGELCALRDNLALFKEQRRRADRHLGRLEGDAAGLGRAGGLRLHAARRLLAARRRRQGVRRVPARRRASRTARPS